MFRIRELESEHSEPMFPLLSSPRAQFALILGRSVILRGAGENILFAAPAVEPVPTLSARAVAIAIGILGLVAMVARS